MFIGTSFADSETLNAANIIGTVLVGNLENSLIVMFVSSFLVLIKGVMLMISLASSYYSIRM